MEAIYDLWDRIADFEASRHQHALDHLLESLCHLIDAANATWFGAVRMPDLVPGDPVHGWRPYGVHALHSNERIQQKGAEETRSLENGEVDITTIRNVAHAGRFRVNRLIDLVDQEWFETDYYRQNYLDFGYRDAIWAGCPLNADTEIYFGLYRAREKAPFSARERDTLATALRGLKWFHRWQLLSRGLVVAHSPLTSAEREVLKGLLSGATEKEIAAAHGHSYHTTHGYVKEIYRKFGVKNRAALMALWLGKPA